HAANVQFSAGFGAVTITLRICHGSGGPDNRKPEGGSGKSRRDLEESVCCQKVFQTGESTAKSLDEVTILSERWNHGFLSKSFEATSCTCGAVLLRKP